MKTAEAIFNQLKEKFGLSIIELKADKPIEPFIIVNPLEVDKICLFLKDEKELLFDSIMNLSGVVDANGTTEKVWMALAVQDPSTNYAVFVAIALLCGLGGGNFSASMANISFFFPKRMQGTALGWNAGAGNLGVGVMQAVVPVSIYGGALAAWAADRRPTAIRR